MIYDDFPEECPVDEDLTVSTWGEGGWTSEDITIREGERGTIDLWITPASRPPRVGTTGTRSIGFARSAVEKIGRRLIQAAGGGYPIEEGFKAGYAKGLSGLGQGRYEERVHAAWVEWLEEWS